MADDLTRTLRLRGYDLITDTLMRAFGMVVLDILFDDVSQMRLTEGEITRHLAEEVAVSITGSKFPGGPIFSNKVLMNPALQKRMNDNISQNGIPAGYETYFTKSDFFDAVPENLLDEDLKNIADAGFSHVHWSHDWLGEYIYSNIEMVQIKQMLEKYNFKNNN